MASRELVPALTGVALIKTKAIIQSSVPRLTQLWMVPRWTSTSPALSFTATPSTVVLNEPEVGSEKPSLLTGKPLVAQITDEEAPGRFDITFFTFSSISTLARPSGLCPVTTRRICKVINASFQFGLIYFCFPLRTMQRSPPCAVRLHAT